MLADLISRPCVITRSVADDDDRDKYGNPLTDAETIDTVCELQQRTRGEDAGADEFSETMWALFFLPHEELDTEATVTVDGHVYELVGEPWIVRNPRTHQVSHIEATAKRTATADDAS